MLYSGIFKYTQPTSDYNAADTPFVNTNGSFTTLTKGTVVNGLNTEVEWTFIFDDTGESTVDGLYLNGTITIPGTMLITDFGLVPLSRQGNQFRDYTGSFPVSSTNIPTLLVNTSCFYMFYKAYGFNHNIESWDTSSVVNMEAMFYKAINFNQPLNNWDVSQVTNMDAMFRNSGFNQNIGSWNTSSVTTMYRMFQNSTFNNGAASGIGTNPLNWDMSLNTNLQYMFLDCSAFNSPLNFTNTENITTLQYMFEDCPTFNQPITFDTSGVEQLSGMFGRAHTFNQPIGNLNITNLIPATLSYSFLVGTNISVENFDFTLKGWAAQSTPTMNVAVESDADYSTDGEPSKLILENTYGWTFSGGTLVSVNKSFSNNYLVQGTTVCEDPIYLTSGTFSLLSNVTLKYKLVESAIYTIGSTDLTVGVNYAGTVTITLPPAVTTPFNGTITNGKQFIILDESGNVSGETNKITIIADGSDSILGGSTVFITTAYGKLTFFSNGVDNWFII
jgi:surface protein